MSGASDVMLLARVTGSLVVVLLLALLAARFARRTSGGRHSGDLRVCERVGLTRETAAVVLESGGRRLLIGVSPAQVTLLADLGPAEPVVPALEATAVEITGTVSDPVSDPVSDAEAAEPLAGSAAEPVVLVPPARRVTIPAPRQPDVRAAATPLSRKAIRELDKHRRVAIPPTQRGTGSVHDPRTWQQGLEALRDLTARRG